MQGRIEDTEVYRRACQFSDEVYAAVQAWPPFARDTFGGQLVRSLDSVGANLVEGEGRGGGADTVRFFRIARGKARRVIEEARADAWLSEATELVKMIQGLIRYRMERTPQVRETMATYDDPFIDADETCPLSLVP